ncbi:MAG: ferrous iron transport protein B [Candidatus Muirbacterium halophilum]|nr:ferrous iron transport protein B [Candidatus Muirbacterium halophilum]
MKKYKIALAGNPNVGKTCIFNSLTGSNQHVGNWPGVTVERKEGYITISGAEYEIVDLPGIYSFSPNTLDEKISRDFLVEEKPDAVILVVDASNLERNLYILTQALELKKKVILVMNMMDIVRKENIKIDIEGLKKILGIPVIEACASKCEGNEEIKKELARLDEWEIPEFRINYGERVDKAIDILGDFFEKKGITYDKRWFAIKTLEDDKQILALIQGRDDSAELFKEIDLAKKEIEKYVNDLDTFFIEKKYGFVSGVVHECVKKSSNLKLRMDVTEKIDSVLTNRLLGIPLFIAMMYFTFQFVFKLGDPMIGWVETIIGFISSGVATILGKMGVPELIISLATDGIIEGVGSVLTFIPVIALLYLAIGILEDTGYMSRAAFVMDKFMHMLGLHGKSFIPMVVGFGCTVPGVMATRTLESKKDRLITILILPFMSCGAKLPIYALFTAAFFGENAGNVVFAMYVIGIATAVIMARLLKSVFFKNEMSPLIMELPPYRLPLLKNLMWKVWYRCTLFVRKAGTVILLGVTVIWFLGAFPQNVDIEHTYLAQVGKVVAPIFKPAGFGNWESSVALTSGLVAKEIVVGTFGTIYGLSENDSEDEGKVANRLRDSGIFTPLTAFGFMVFSLLYVPCMAAVGAIKKEAGWNWAIFATVYTTTTAWVAAVLIYQVGSLI